MSITSSDRAVVPESVESNELVELAEAVVAEAAQADGVVTEASDEAAEASDASDASDAEPALTFGSLGLADSIVRKLAQNGVTTPFPIQAATIPDAPAGKEILRQDAGLRPPAADRAVRRHHRAEEAARHHPHPDA